MIEKFFTTKKIKDLEHGDVFILNTTVISEEKPLLAISPDRLDEQVEERYSPDRICGLELHCLDNFHCTLSTYHLHPEMNVAVVKQKKDMEEL